MLACSDPLAMHEPLLRAESENGIIIWLRNWRNIDKRRPLSNEGLCDWPDGKNGEDSPPPNGSKKCVTQT
jgi:hypothetical protein